jgi:hypothetical protein
VDGAFLTERQLGNTYRASLLLYRPEKKAERSPR